MGTEVMTGAKNRILLFAFVVLFSLVLGVHFCFALTTQFTSLTISSPVDYDAPQTCLSPSNSAHYDYDTPGKFLGYTTFCFSEFPLHEKVSFLDFFSGQGGKAAGDFIFSGMTKAEARAAAQSMGLTNAQQAAVNSAISRSTSTNLVKVTQYGSDVVVQVIRPGTNGYQILESVVTPNGTKTVVQKAWDATGALDHFHPK
jgi:hypothetical protein